MPVIRISNIVFKRLEKYAVGFDNPANVIERLLNRAEGINTADLSAGENSDILPITLIPADPEQFRTELLKTKKAIIRINYGKVVEEKPWNASKFNESSDVIRNLRSREEFRQGNWQSLGIKDVIVRIA